MKFNILFIGIGALGAGAPFTFWSLPFSHSLKLSKLCMGEPTLDTTKEYRIMANV